MLNKMKSLIAQLKEADAAYYGKDNPIMTLSLIHISQPTRHSQESRMTRSAG